MAERAPRTAEQLATEAAQCIEDNGLTGEELRLYLAAWIACCAVDGDLDAMRRGYELGSRRLERELRKDTPSEEG